MIRYITSILGESSSVDRDTNRMSIFNILENIDITTDQVDLKGIPIKFNLITLWERTEESPHEGVLRVSQIGPSGKRSEVIETRIDLTKSQFHRTRIIINGMPISGTGRYVFRLDYKEGESKWKKAAELPLVINITQR